MKTTRKVLSMLLALAMMVSILSSMGCAADAAPELGPVTSKDVVYQIITDRFYDGDTSNNTPDGFDPTLYDGTGSDLKLSVFVTQSVIARTMTLVTWSCLPCLPFSKPAE